MNNFEPLSNKYKEIEKKARFAEIDRQYVQKKKLIDLGLDKVIINLNTTIDDLREAVKELQNK